MGRKKSSSKKKSAAASRGLVGPDYVQVLTGSLASGADGDRRNVALVLCGESHHDAIDVTRAGGGKMKEGWIDSDFVELTGEMVGKIGGIRADEDVRFHCGTCKRNNKLLPLGKAKEWGFSVGNEEINYIEDANEMALLWIPSKDGDGKRGRSFLLELILDESEGEGRSRSHLPPEVTTLLGRMSSVATNMRGVKSLHKVVQDVKDGNIAGWSDEKKDHVLLSWADMDAEARVINHRRLLGEDIPMSEYDELICKRKKELQKNENVWTWDDWLVEVRSKLSNNNAESPAMHVVIESSIPPWEVELCRDIMPEFEYCQAADCIRCVSEDSCQSETDAFDPSSDGIGSYMDYIYRKLLGVERSPNNNSNGAENNAFLHCVDCRDLGCEHACVEDSLKTEWMDLLEPEEKERLLGSGPDAPHAHHKDGRCLPDWCHSPEESELDQLRSSGVLKSDGTDDEQCDSDVDDDIITFPSLESFFGQCTDILYYTPHYKVAYGPFLGKCVQSYEKWNDFFVELFFGGTIERAIGMLDLSSNNRPYLHVRSPIMKCWNASTGEYEWHRRENEESDLTLPLFPIKSVLKARGSNPARTWSSDVISTLLESDCQELRDLATNARDWALKDIQKHADDPKLSDDEIGGGEWFLGYLRQCHREIYDDIDISDAPALLKKQYAAGERKKHKIGSIRIPSCRDGFQMVTDKLSDLEGKTLDAEAEVMAKILIDIYMSKLIDVSTVVKIGQIISQDTTNRNIVVVCYMGSLHTRAVSDFFCQPSYGFKRKIFRGKQDWDMDEGRIMHLPAELWNVGALFK